MEPQLREEQRGLGSAPLRSPWWKEAQEEGEGARRQLVMPLLDPASGPRLLPTEPGPVCPPLAPASWAPCSSPE